VRVALPNDNSSQDSIPSSPAAFVLLPFRLQVAPAAAGRPEAREGYFKTGDPARENLAEVAA
jgi:hypothetical protein